MEENQEKLEQATPPTDDTNVDYIKALKEMRDNSVSKEQYNKIKEDNARLIQSLVNGEQLNINSNSDKVRTASEIRQDLQKESTNLAFIKNALELRNLILEEQGKDIFVAEGRMISPTNEDRVSAQQVADLFQTCVDECNGDSGVFTSILQSHIIDTPAMYLKKK